VAKNSGESVFDEIASWKTHQQVMAIFPFADIVSSAIGGLPSA
jgi:hypothetical protein